MKKLPVKLLLAVGVILLLLGYWLFASLHSQNAVDRYKAQLRAAGEKLDVSELIPPAVNPESNGVEFFNQIGAALSSVRSGMLETNDPPAMRMVSPGKAMVGWRQSEIITVYGGTATNTWQDLEDALQPEAYAIEWLHKTAERPELDFGLDYHALPESIHMEPLMHMKAAALLLSPAVVADLHRGDTESAVTNLHALLALTASWREPLVISQLVRLAMESIASVAQWEVLQTTNVTDEQLAFLQRDWEKLDIVKTFESSLVMERDFQCVGIEHLRTSNSPTAVAASTFAMWGSGGGGSGSGGFSELLYSVGKAARRKAVDSLWRASWSYDDELHALRANQAMVETLRRVARDGFFQDALADLERNINTLGMSHTNAAWLRNSLDTELLSYSAEISTSTIQGTINRALSGEVTRKVVTTAIALKRYELRHGALPPDLPALVPEFLTEVPRDPVDGKPLRYHPNANGTYLLYSIGLDAKDGGGDVTPSGTYKTFYWERAPDWVWPQPATPAEVQNYYDHPPK